MAATSIRQDVNAPLIVLIGVVSGLLLLVIVFGLQAWFVREESAEIAAKWRVSKNQWLDDLRAEQLAKIQKAGFADPEKTKPTLPIAQGMQLMIQSNGKLPKPPATKPAAAGGQQQQQPKQPEQPKK
jgi:hypothetical protein